MTQTGEESGGVPGRRARYRPKARQRTVSFTEEFDRALVKAARREGLSVSDALEDAGRRAFGMARCGE